MSRRMQENLMGAALMLVLAGFLVVGMSYGPKTRLVPVPLTIVSMLLLAAEMVLQNVRPDIKLSVDTMEVFAKVQEDGDEEEAVPGAPKPSTSRKELQGIGLVLLFVGMILVLGLMPAALVFVFGYFVLIGRERWFKSLIYSGVSIGVLYLLFVSLLGTQTYDGLLGAFVEGLL